MFTSKACRPSSGKAGWTGQAGLLCGTQGQQPQHQMRDPLSFHLLAHQGGPGVKPEESGCPGHLAETGTGAEGSLEH